MKDPVREKEKVGPFECKGLERLLAYVFSFSEHFREIPAKIHQIFIEKSEKSSETRDENENSFFYSGKKFDIFFAEISKSERCKSMYIL